MKRFVCVPEHLSKDGIPLQAQNLSKDSQLPIRISKDHKEICIDSFPETFQVESADWVESGYIYWLDITDEFNILDEKICLLSTLDGVEYKNFPIVKEKHLARFRCRFFNKGEYNYKVLNDDMLLCEGKFIIK